MKRRTKLIALICAVIALATAVHASAASAAKVEQNITVDGNAVQMQGFAINGENYFSLRDIAAVLKGTDAQFGISYDGAANTVVITKGAVPEETADKSDAADHVISKHALEVDGKTVTTEMYNVGGYNCLTLRSIAKILDIRMDYGDVIALRTDKPYAYETDLSKALAEGIYEWELSEDGSHYALKGVVYCAFPAEDAKYTNRSAGIKDLRETMNIYVPAEYFGGGSVNGYTAETAPVVFHQECAGWASSSPTSVNAEYIKNGFVYVSVGVRSRGAGTDSETGEDLGKAPIPAVDMKAALRFLRANADELHSAMEKIISVGGSGGGQMSSIFGASGDMEEYYPYLYEIGACGIEYDKTTGTYTSTVSDAPYGCMCYCPIADLNNADMAYAWFRWDAGDTGVNKTVFSEFQLALQNDLAYGFCEYINELDITDETGEKLGFDVDENGEIISPRQGSYYDRMLANISDAFNKYAANTQWTTARFESVDAMIASYDDADSWLEKQEDGTYKITDLAGFINGIGLTRNKNIPGFDTFWKTAENNAFGSVTEKSAHFSASVAAVLKENHEAYSKMEGFAECDVDAYIEEANREDIVRQTELMNATHILLDGDSNPAKHWRTRNGTSDQHTSFTVAYNLCMAALDNEEVESVDYALVWNMGHGSNEGTTTGSFVEWIHNICK